MTDEDRQAAAALLDEALTGGYSYDGANELVARALVAEREKARAPFLALAEELDAESRRAALLTSMAAVVATRVNRETADAIRRAAEDIR